MGVEARLAKLEKLLTPRRTFFVLWDQAGGETREAALAREVPADYDPAQDVIHVFVYVDFWGGDTTRPAPPAARPAPPPRPEPPVGEGDAEVWGVVEPRW
jgi:hypothetical protein